MIWLTRMAVGALALAFCDGCATNTDPGSTLRPSDGGSSTESAGSGTAGGGQSSSGAGGTDNGGADVGVAGTAIGGSDETTGGTAFGGSTSDTGGSDTGVTIGPSPAGTATISISSFSLTGCSVTATATDLAAKDNGLTAPKPTQSYISGTFTVNYTVTGQYGQVGVDLPMPSDLSACTISATLSATASPPCGVFAVPFFYDATLGTVAPYDMGKGRFVGEEISDLNGASATINFKASGATLSTVSRVGINVYNCPDSVTVGDLSVAK
jgi:hypothetical protein